MSPLPSLRYAMTPASRYGASANVQLPSVRHILRTVLTKSSASNTMGTMPMMRGSATAPVNHVVAPRLDAPAVTKRASLAPVLFCTNAVVASSALMAALAMGKYAMRSGWSVWFSM